MDIAESIKALYEERDLLNQAIAALERVGAGAHGKRRGRPPKWLVQVRAATGTNGAVAHHVEHNGTQNGTNNGTNNGTARKSNKKQGRGG